VVEADIEMYNLGTLKPVDVTLFVSIRDFDGNDLFSREETFAVNEQKLVHKRLMLPKDIQPGNYLVYSKLTHDGTVAVSSRLLTVIPKELKESKLAIIQKAVKKFSGISIAIILVLVLLSGFLYLQRKQKITIKVPKERVIETKEGQVQIILEKPEAIKVAEKVERLAKEKPAEIIISEKEIEISKLLKQIEEWKKLGYDTTILELEIKALEDETLRGLIKQLKEWKSKGYNTLILEEKIKSIYSYGKKSQDIGQLENKIQEWKRKGYNTLVLEERLNRLMKK
jgi:hypothetical protein